MSWDGVRRVSPRGSLWPSLMEITTTPWMERYIQRSWEKKTDRDSLCAPPIHPLTTPPTHAQIGGILSRPSPLECRLDVNHMYSDSDLYDYPSAGVISDVLVANRITPIFVVPSQVRSWSTGTWLG